MIIIALLGFVAAPQSQADALRAGMAAVPDYNANERTRAEADWLDADRDRAQIDVERMKVRKRVGALIATGKCADAKKEALRSGELELAATVPSLCEAP